MSNISLQVTRGGCRYRSGRAERVHLRWPGPVSPTDGFYGRRGRLVGQVPFEEGESLAPELNRYTNFCKAVA